MKKVLILGLVSFCILIGGCSQQEEVSADKPVAERTDWIPSIRKRLDELKAEELAKYPPIMTQAEKDVVCAKVKKGEYKKIPLLTAKEAGMDFEEIEREFSKQGLGASYIGENYGPIIAFVDFNNDGELEVLFRAMYASGAGSGASFLHFYVRDNNGKFASVVAGTPRSPIGRYNDTTYSISGKGGGNFL